MSPTVLILLWGLAFLATHLVPVHPPLRRALVGALGERGYVGLYSVVSFATGLPWAWVWWHNRHAGPLLWDLRGVTGLDHLVELLVVVGFALLAGGALSPAPSSHFYRGKGMPVRGPSALTRHPLMIGLSLWAAGHLLCNGWAGDVAFFGIFTAVALLGALHQDMRKSAADPKYAAFKARTTFFLAPSPRALRSVGLRGWLAMGAGAIGACILRMFHPYLFG